MKTLCFSTSMAFAVLVCLICSTPPCASQEAGQMASPSNAGESYPNTADGMHSLLTDLLATAKDDDQGKVWSKIAEMEIPDYENWFARTYGQEKGQALKGYDVFDGLGDPATAGSDAFWSTTHLSVL